MKHNIEIIGNNPPFFAVLESVEKVCINHRKLGEEGKKKDVINQFGEQALRADLEAETTIIGELKSFAEKNNIALEIRGEETGTTNLGNNGEKYFGTLDGLDGSSNYLAPNDWSYGTMLAIARGDNPIYSDFEIAAIGFPQENMVLIAAKNIGVFMFDIDNQELKKIKPFENCDYDQTKILSDNYFPEAKKMLGKMESVWPKTGSEATSILAMVNGEWQGMADVTRKGNLEQPMLYLILLELGGAVVDKNGKDIGENNFKDWGQQEKLPIISARSQSIAGKILSELNL